MSVETLNLPKPPPQVINNLTGYPTWRTVYPGWDSEHLNSVIFMSLTGILFGTILAAKYRQRINSLSIQDASRNLSVFFQTVVTLYLAGTFLTVLAFWFVDVGKVWVALGVLHNAMEVAVLMTLAFARYPKGFQYFYGALFFYWAWTQVLAIILPFPHDALYFKFQGLILDIALVINFRRLMKSNSPNATGHITLGSDPDIPSSRNKNPSRIVATSSTSYDDASTDSSSDRKPDRNGDIWIMWVAAIIHLVGNSIPVMSLSMWPFLFFQFTYGITYPMYGYYIARQSSAQSRTIWYETSMRKELGVFLVGLVGSVLVVGVGIAVSLNYYSHHP